MNKRFLEKFINIILILSLIALTGSSAFFSYQAGYLFLFPLIIFFTRKLKILPQHIYFLIFIVSLIFIQNIIHTGGVAFNSAALQVANIFTIYLISRIVAYDFPILFRKIILTISIISLIFWVGMQFSDKFHNDLIIFAKEFPQLSSDEKKEIIVPDQYMHFYIFTVPITDTLRNPGLFFEPGRFAIVIILALSINLFTIKKRIFNYENIIYIFTLITTFSTTGYYALIFVFSSRLLLFYHKPFNLILSIITIPLLIFYINQLEFMWTKVTADMSNIMNYSRFAAMDYHFELISQSPLFGWGDHIKDLELSPNGLTLLVVRWGILFSVVYFIFLYNGVYRLIDSNRSEKIIQTVVFIVLLLVTFSQTATTEALYMALMFFGLYKSKIITNCA